MNDGKEIYCNLTQCFFNRPLGEPHQKEGRPGFIPLAGTGIFKGICGKSNIRIKQKRYLSSTRQLQSLAICDDFSIEEKLSESKETQNEVRISCDRRDCLFNTAKKEGDVGECIKFDNDDKPLYVDSKTVYDGNDRIIVPQCESFSNKLYKGHFDWSKAAAGNRGNSGAFPHMPTRPSIRGKW